MLDSSFVSDLKVAYSFNQESLITSLTESLHLFLIQLKTPGSVLCESEIHRFFSHLEKKKTFICSICFGKNRLSDHLLHLHYMLHVCLGSKSSAQSDLQA